GVRDEVARETEQIQSTATAIADLDALTGLATVAAKRNYCRPTVGADEIHIENGRHPVVERAQGQFVPNDTVMNQDDRIVVVTGPNMSGKSTYMRQVAHIVLLAQVGSFVPADVARLEIFEKIFTRVGASDDIAGGRSTFMVEMTELAEILQDA
ncbi:MAG: DNA mismatch repair protein MutS, partial [Halobacteriaceae archaeon]